MNAEGCDNIKDEGKETTRDDHVCGISIIVAQVFNYCRSDKKIASYPYIYTNVKKPVNLIKPLSNTSIWLHLFVNRES